METSDGIAKAVDAAERALRTGDAHDALRASVAAIQRALADGRTHTDAIVWLLDRESVA